MANEFRPEETLKPGWEQLTLRDVQVIAFDILLALREYCQKHSLKLYLCGGTLLGAVRHKGFIPWDDDVDAFMSRPDYEKLIELSKQYPIRDDLKLACPQNGEFNRPYIRVYKTDTAVERKLLDKNSGAYVWLDILPVDGLPKNKVKLDLLYKLRWLINKMNLVSMWKPGVGRSKLTIFKKTLARPLARAVGAHRWAMLLERIAKSRPFEKNDTVGCYAAGRYGIGEAMPKSEYVIPVKVTFEGEQFDTMSCWKTYLTGIYRDYMKLPPEDHRVPHLDFTSMDSKKLAKLRQKYAYMYEKQS